MTTNDTSTDRFFLDDFAVGQRFASTSTTVTEEDIIAFARQYDPQPFHLDDEAAKSTLFGGLAASGWHTAALTMRLLVGGGLPIAGGIIGAGGDIAWPAPTRPGDVLTVLSEVLEIRPSKSKPTQGMVIFSCETQNQQRQTVQRLTAKLIVQRRPQQEIHE